MKKIKNKPPKSVVKRKLQIEQNERGIVVNQEGLVGAGIVNVVFGTILTLVALRFIFRLLGANPDSAISSLVYNLSQPLVAPFVGLFSNQAQLETARFEVATLIALVVYGLIAGLLARMLVVNHRHHV